MNSKMSARYITTIGVLGAMGIILMLIPGIPIPLLPTFLTLDLSDIPAIVGGIYLGPLAGLLIELIKKLVSGLIGTKTGGIGELANFVMGVALVVPISYFYRKNKNIKGYILGAIVGAVLMVVIGALFNYYVLLPIYAKFISADDVELNSLFANMFKLIFFAIVPFNAIKAIVVSALSYIFIKLLKPAFRNI